MDLIEDVDGLVEKLKNPTLKEVLDTASDYIMGLDFSQKDVREAGIQFLRSIFTKIDNKQPLNDLHIRAIYAVTAKIAMTDYGLTDTKVRFLDKKDDPTSGYAAAYCRGDTVTFFNDFIYNNYVKSTKIDPKTHEPVVDPRTRMAVLTGDIMRVAFHEFEHAVQHRRTVELGDDIYRFTSKDYLMSRSSIAVQLSGVMPEYFQDGYYHSVYGINHDKFMGEIDANDVAERELRSIYDELGLECIQKHNLIVFSEVREKELKGYMDDLLGIEWKHSTNPNNMPVKSNFKISFMIDTALKSVDKKEREAFIKSNPILQLSYWPDGRRKTLGDVERERDRAKEEMLKTLSSDEIAERVPNLIELYETVIEGDPMLSMERALQKMVDLTWESERVFTSNGVRSKYSRKEREAEVLLLMAKVKDIIKYVEPAEFYPIYEMLEKANKRLDRVGYKSPATSDMYWFKKEQIRALEKEFMSDSAKEKGVKDEQKAQAKQEQERKDAFALLKRYFPDFNPNPFVFTGTLSQIVMEPNLLEAKMILNAASKVFNSHRREFDASGDYVPLIKAIKLIYDFDYQSVDNMQYQEALKRGVIKMPENVFEREQRLRKEAKMANELSDAEKEELNSGKVDLRLGETKKDDKETDGKDDDFKTREIKRTHVREPEEEEEKKHGFEMGR